jgi:hypothetical protein
VDGTRARRRGTLLSIIGIVPVPWVGLVAVLIGGLLLLAGFVFSIVGLAGKRYGGKPLSITALVLSLVGATIGSFALIWSIILVGVSSAGSSIDEMMSTLARPFRRGQPRRHPARRGRRFRDADGVGGAAGVHRRCPPEGQPDPRRGRSDGDAGDHRAGPPRRIADPHRRDAAHDR